MTNPMIKVLWPDGPRLVSGNKIQLAAHDALVHEEGADPETTKIPKLEDAIEIVNHYGYYTTEKR